MKNFIVLGGNIVGITDEIPNNETVFANPDNLEIADVYWDGEIIPKPDRPSPQHYWDEQTHTWIAPAIENISIFFNWDMLVASLFNSPEWAKAYSASEKTLKANTAFTTLLTTLTNLRRVETLEFAIAKLREAMTGIAGIGDFTTEEIASINGKLTAAGFDLQLSPAPSP